MSDGEGGYDGPNIRPPQPANKAAGGGSGSQQRERRPHRPQAYSRNRNEKRRERRHGSGGRQERRDGGGRPRGGTSHQERADHRGSGGGSHPVSHNDLRHRMNRNKHGRDRDLREKHRDSGGGGGGRGHHRDSGGAPSHHSSSRGHHSSSSGSSKPVDSHHRHDEARQKRRELEREMAVIEETLKRKRERSKERTSHKKHRKPSKSGENSSDKKAGDEAVEEEADDTEEEEEGEDEDGEEESSEEGEEEEEEEGSGEEESGDEEEEESGSGTASESGSGEDTASERSGATPDRSDDEEGLEEGERKASPGSLAVPRPVQADRRRGSQEGADSAEGRWGERGEGSPTAGERRPRRGGSRTPSRSPTPRRDSRDSSFERDKEGGRLDDRPEELIKEIEDDMDVQQEDEDADERERARDPRDDLPPYLPSVSGCRSVEEFQCLNRIEEGTYGVVYRARDKRTNETVALKRLKMEREKEGFPITSLREINTLLISQHPNVVTVREIVVGSNTDKIYIVMDFVEHDMKSLMETMRKKQQVFLPGEVKCLMHQLLSAISHLHDNWILHRDLKSSNLLLSHHGILKVGDFGLAREYGSPLQAYTAIVVTLWYRAPELLLGIKEYSTPIDVWSIGCIFGEFLTMNPVFPGESEIDELNRIYKLLGTPSEKIWPGYNKLPGPQKMKFIDFPVGNLRSKFPRDMLSDLGMDFLKKLLTYDPKKRLTCDQALQHEYFYEHPTAIDPSMFPTWPAKSEGGAVSGSVKKAASPKPPSGGGAFKKINDDDDEKLAAAAAGGAGGGGFQLNFGASSGTANWNLKF